MPGPPFPKAKQSLSKGRPRTGTSLLAHFMGPKEVTTPGGSRPGEVGPAPGWVQLRAHAGRE